MRCRGRNPRRVVSVDDVSFSATRDDGRSGSGQTLEQSEVHERIRRQLHRCRRPETRGNTPKADPERGRGQGGIVEPMRRYRDFGKTLKDA
jgi:hypothetical protein